MIFSKSGNHSITTKITIPVPWAKELGFTTDNRTGTLEINENKIILKKD